MSTLEIILQLTLGRTFGDREKKFCQKQENVEQSDQLSCMMYDRDENPPLWVSVKVSQSVLQFVFVTSVRMYHVDFRRKCIKIHSFSSENKSRETKVYSPCLLDRHEPPQNLLSPIKWEPCSRWHLNRVNELTRFPCVFDSLHLDVRILSHPTLCGGKISSFPPFQLIIVFGTKSWCSLKDKISVWLRYFAVYFNITKHGKMPSWYQPSPR